jgi:hypothetical protein
MKGQAIARLTHDHKTVPYSPRASVTNSADTLMTEIIEEDDSKHLLILVTRDISSLAVLDIYLDVHGEWRDTVQYWKYSRISPVRTQGHSRRLRQ